MNTSHVIDGSLAGTFRRTDGPTTVAGRYSKN
jgi:hypothetical protein